MSAPLVKILELNRAAIIISQLSRYYSFAGGLSRRTAGQASQSGMPDQIIELNGRPQAKEKNYISVSSVSLW
jgi:hypothetical protein